MDADSTTSRLVMTAVPGYSPPCLRLFYYISLRNIPHRFITNRSCGTTPSTYLLVTRATMGRSEYCSAQSFLPNVLGLSHPFPAPDGCAGAAAGGRHA